MNFKLSVFLISIFLLSISSVHAQTTEPEIITNDPTYQAAADYSAAHRGDAVLVYVDGILVFEEYQNGYDGARPHLLASGTKSFSCAIAVAAIQDGLLSFDERVADTITEWADDPQRSTITVRQLLSLTSGMEGAQDVLQGPAIADKNIAALSIPLTYAPGKRFQYGPSNYYVFGELIERKLGGEDVVDYLMRRVLDPIDLVVGNWNRDQEGNPNLPGGASLTARNWAKFGQLILQGGMWNDEQLLQTDLLNECFIGSNANPNYGLTWWLQYSLTDIVDAERTVVTSPEPGNIPEGVILGETTPDIIFAAGAGKQRMYIIPSQNTVIVRLGRQDRRFDDAEFLTLLTGS